jgi:hypothetical protein
MSTSGAVPRDEPAVASPTGSGRARVSAEAFLALLDTEVYWDVA